MGQLNVLLQQLFIVFMYVDTSASPVRKEGQVERCLYVAEKLMMCLQVAVSENIDLLVAAAVAAWFHVSPALTL